MIGYYVGVRNGNRRGLLAGPFDSAVEADARVEDVRREAEKIYSWSHFYTLTTETVRGAKLPSGSLNSRLDIP